MRKAFLRAFAPPCRAVAGSAIGRTSRHLRRARTITAWASWCPTVRTGHRIVPRAAAWATPWSSAGPRGLDTATLRYGTYHFDNQPSADQTITLSLYKPDGPADLTGPGLNGNQPGTLIGSRSITTSLFNAPDSGSDLLTFDFGGLVVPDSLVAIVSSTLISNANTQTGFIASSDFTPLVGSNPHGDRLWFGEGPGTFSSDDTSGRRPTAAETRRPPTTWSLCSTPTMFPSLRPLRCSWPAALCCSAAAAGRGLTEGLRGIG